MDTFFWIVDQAGRAICLAMLINLLGLAARHASANR